MSGLETERRGPDARPQYTRDFDAVADAERALVETQRAQRGVAPDEPTVGLAISGGGVRSATFGLGVLEALDEAGLFRRVDYLSTVSGGGFIGSALTWFLGQTHGRFPFTGHSAGPGPQGVRVGDFLRLHANYLDHRTPADDERPPEKAGDLDGRMGAQGHDGAPGQGHDGVTGQGHESGRRTSNAGRQGFSVAGLLAVVGQQMLITLLVYGGLLVVLFFLLHSFDTLLRPLKAILALRLNIPPTTFWLAHTNFLMLVGLALLLAYMLLAPWYSLRMFLASRLGRGRRDATLGRNREYRLRLSMERTVQAVLHAAIVSIVVGSVPLVAEWVALWIDQRWLRSGAYGTVAAVGGLVGLVQHGPVRATRDPNASAGGMAGTLLRLLRTPLAMRIVASATLFALLMVAHSLAVTILDGRTVWFFWTLAAGVLAFGFLSDVNTLGSHRVYRDRLMETYLPDRDAVDSGHWSPAWSANARLLEDAATAGGPYHLFNTSLSTRGSSDPRLHGRGADSFVLAPLFSGSGATGWRRTSSWPRRRFTVPTAMAVSAAAVNPGAGSAGRGITTGWSVSALLALLNLRLGYWVDNPDPDAEPRGRRKRPGLLQAGRFPIHVSRRFPWIRLRSPLLMSLLPHPFGPRQHEHRPWVQLDDGGAFEPTGIYELVRRRVDLIVFSDATGDANYTFEGFGDLVERIWNDFGVSITFVDQERGLHAIRPGSADVPPGPDGAVLSERAHTTAHIHYPARDGQPAKTGTLVLIKAALIPGLPVNVLTYRAQHPEFPNESTFNQFFDARQFEAYRGLGYYTGSQTLADLSMTDQVAPSAPDENG